MILLYMLMILLSTLSEVRRLIFGNCQQLSLVSEPESDLQDNVGRDRKRLFDYNVRKTQLSHLISLIIIMVLL